MKNLFKQKKIILFALLFTTTNTFAKEAENNLKFNSDKKFKIVQLTDIHWRDSLPNKEAGQRFTGDILDAEKPDLVILTGDIITSNQTAEDWKQLIQPIIDRKIPWSYTSGNHDSEYNMKKHDIFLSIKDLPYSLVELGPQDVAGRGNSTISIRNSNNNEIASVIYLLDSHSGPQIEGMGSYGWIEKTQIDWYMDESAKFTKQNNNKPLPSLAFFHTPFPEFKDVAKNNTTVGSHGEPVCSPVYNSGMFQAIKDSKDVMGVFVGHDHNNDFIGTLDNVALAYGRISGFDDVRALQRGARVIVMEENTRAFSSWIRTASGNTLNKVHYPTSFENN